MCQTGGTKRWRLYAPVGGHALPSVSSGDLAEADLGEPIADITLQVLQRFWLTFQGFEIAAVMIYSRTLCYPACIGLEALQ